MCSFTNSASKERAFSAFIVLVSFHQENKRRKKITFTRVHIHVHEKENENNVTVNRIHHSLKLAV